MTNLSVHAGPSPETATLRLPGDLAGSVAAKVASGEFADEEAVIRAALRALDSAEASPAAEERLRVAEVAGEIGLWDLDLDTGGMEWSEGFRRVWGLGATDPGPSLDALLQAVHPDDRESVARGIRSAADGWSAEFRARGADGAMRWLAARGEVRRAPDGAPRMLGVVFDVGERRQVEEALRARTLELEAVLGTVPAAVWFTYDPVVKRVLRNRFAADLMRVPPPTTTSFASPDRASLSHVRVLKDGVEVPAEEMPLQAAMRGETRRDEEYTFAFEDGSVRTLLSNATALRDEGGRIVGAVSVSLDITERKLAEEHLRLLVNELNHRVKNTLATVQSVVFQTLRSWDVDPGVQRTLEARLAALSAAHNVLTERNWESADASDVVAAALAPYRANTGRFRISGPGLQLRPKTALALSMALHELCTNAVKYGALSNEGGRVEIVWEVAGSPAGQRFRLRWSESGGPPVVPPSRKGFGSRLVERGLAAELRGEVRLSYDPGGLVCTIDAPLPDSD